MSMTRLARPYANAAFDYAQDHQQLKQWSTFLCILAERMQQSLIVEILKNPKYSAETRCEVVLALVQDKLDTPKENFVKVLANQKRLALLPDIYILFEQLRVAVGKTLNVRVKSAAALSDIHSAKLNDALSKQLGRRVALSYEIDPSLLGGFIAYAEDRVFDSSVRGQLEKLRNVVMG